jgi:hypothetical protein
VYRGYLITTPLVLFCYGFDGNANPHTLLFNLFQQGQEHDSIQGPAKGCVGQVSPSAHRFPNTVKVAIAFSFSVVVHWEGCLVATGCDYEGQEA